MELAEIIKWVDKKNLDLRSAEFDLTFEGGQEEIGIYPKDYNSEYIEYKYALANYFLLTDKENKKALVRRLFRSSYSFFKHCCEQRAMTDDGLWLYTMRTSILVPPYDDAPHFMPSAIWEQMCIEHELANFYVEVLQLCKESGLLPLELYPYEHKGLSEVFADMILPSKPQSCDKNTIEAYIIKDKDNILKVIDDKLANSKKTNNNGEGRGVALIICTLLKYGYMNLEGKTMTDIINAFRVKYPTKIGSRQSISSYINATLKETYCNGYKPIANNEMEELKNKFITRNKTQ